MQWWREARFGLFLHWGLYSVLGGEWKGETGYGEWIRNNAEIPIDTYDTLRQHFDPVLFDADEWVTIAKEAGMKYIVLTSKHHDGFCLFDSKHTDFDVMSTPFSRDIVRELAEACRRHGIAFGLYHSIMDWHHPDYLPRRTWEHDRPSGDAVFDRYVSHMKDQLEELLTDYGPIGILWFDGEWEATWNESRGSDLYRYVRSLQPRIIVNNRVGAAREGMEGMTAAGKLGGDFGTPEQQVPSMGMPGVDWESCMTMNQSWGYSRSDTNYKSSTELIRTLIDIASKGGNFLLNVGPKADGTFPDESVERLRDIGSWMRQNGESIYGTTASPFEEIGWGRATMRRSDDTSTLYLHVFDPPSDGVLRIRGLLSDPLAAYALQDPVRNPLLTRREQDEIFVDLSSVHCAGPATVIAMRFQGDPQVMNPPVISSSLTFFIDSLRVELRGDGGCIVRYTLDGTMPTAGSPAATGSVVLDASAVLTARFFREGIPASGPRSRVFTKVKPIAPSPVQSTAPGLRYAYFEGSWFSIPDFSTLQPLATGSVDSISLGPSIIEEHFGLTFAGLVAVPVTGVYSFSIASDDGSRLWVHDSLIVDNDGLHALAEKSGHIALRAGLHPFRLAFFQRSGGHEVRAFIQGPGMDRTRLGPGFLFMEE